MNPFEEIETNVPIKETMKIEIWIEEAGRKCNTFVSGWDLPDAELKKHLKDLKKNCNCNGTIKELDNVITDTKTKVLLLQGDHSKYIKDYIIASGINKEDIRGKGKL
jgi:translation initiation factor 1 (eIF-1/SUI1)